MKISAPLRSADAKEMRRQGELAFTMIEIAIAIGVIGFALVAIIGILPTGMGTQKDNREDTVISQDAPYFLDAIRNGGVVTTNAFGNPVLVPSAEGLDFLTNYVQSIKFTYYTAAPGATPTVASNIVFNNFYSGAEIIGLLTTPQANYASPYFSNNYFDVTATVRALSSPATEQQSGANSALNSFMAFTYNMEVMINPFDPFAPGMPTTNWTAPGLVDTNLVNIYSNRWLEAASGALQNNLFDVRLRFSWPVTVAGASQTVGPHHQTYRSLIGSQMVAIPNLTNGMPGWYFQPLTYTNMSPHSL